ncbi:large conductance mechanosensitive channel [Maribacter vaceletii]|uniref:Large-conductance mechanosensitive channel n=1 Tax=Maribacter vaceletii TaxID=1206816 RepID=A0A495E7J1_9FLAO|nr:large conductance mechanosensitive channel protein MscL [Maribacter vaceletii]RKR12900.1 large conductance mechanosensitive channel [Maribacter vaceletii]
MKKFIEEFKNFAVKGNMIDMAIGIIVGTAFNKVVNTLVKKIIMPPLSLLSEGVTLTNRKIILREGNGNGIEEVAIWYGELIEVLIDFGIISLTIFVVLKFINHFKDKAENPEDKTVATPKDIELLSKMEQLLKRQNEILEKNNK